MKESMPQQKTVGRIVLLGGIAGCILSQVLFFPSYYSSDDEGCYVSMAFMFARGRLSGERIEDLNLYCFSPVHGRLVGIYDFGMSCLLAPFTWLGDRAVFLFNILIHLLGFVVFWLLLRTAGVHPAFSLLYLLHPMLWFSSRNIVNDLPAGVLFLGGAYLLLAVSRATLVSGFLMAMAVFVRPATGVFVAGFLAGWFVTALLAKRAEGELPACCRDVCKKTAMLALGAALPLALLLAYNTAILGSPFGAARFRILPGQGYSLRNVPWNLLRYGGALTVVYPLMLVLFFFYRGPWRWPMWLSLIAGAVLYLPLGFWGRMESVRYQIAEQLVIGPHYFIAVLAFLLFAYCTFLDRLAARFKRSFWVPYAVAVAVLFSGDIAMSVVHQEQMNQAAYFRDLLFDNTPKGALVLMDRPTRTRISAAVTRPRRLMWAFPFASPPGPSLEELDRLVKPYGEAYVTDLTAGPMWTTDLSAQRDRDTLINRYPHQLVLDVERKGWRFRLTRIQADRRSELSSTPLETKP
jgi:hypothetical protein